VAIRNPGVWSVVFLGVGVRSPRCGESAGRYVGAADREVAMEVRRVRLASSPVSLAGPVPVLHRQCFWVAHGSPLILVECKNWTEKPGMPELRIFESKIRDRGALCKIGIFVSVSGFTKTFLKRLKKFRSADGVIFAIDGADLEWIVTSKMRLTDWLREEGIRRSLGE
jgi:hypothetical protein